jgi:hypothetical protein
VTDRAEKSDAEALQRELEKTRAEFSAAESRARTYLVHRGVLDQTSRGLSVLLREPSRASSKT